MSTKNLENFLSRPQCAYGIELEAISPVLKAQNRLTHLPRSPSACDFDNKSFSPGLKNKVTKLCETIATFALSYSKYAIDLIAKVAISPFTTKNTDIIKNPISSDKFLKTETTPTIIQKVTKISEFTIKPYESLMQYLPGITNIFYAPYEFFKGLTASSNSAKNKDVETHLDAIIRTIQTPFSFIHGICSLYINSIYILSLIVSKISLIKIVSSSIAKTTFILGLIVTLFEAVIEIIGLFRSVILSINPIFSVQGTIKKLKQISSVEKKKDFLSELIQNLKKNEKSLVKKHGYLGIHNILKTLISYQNELSLSPSTADIDKLETTLLYYHLENFRKRNIDAAPLQIKQIMDSSHSINIEQAKDLSEKINLEKLSKRIATWAAVKVKNDIDPILNALKSSDPSIRKNAIEKANGLINMMHTQNTKKIIIHVIGLIAIALTLSGLIFSTVLLFNPLLLLPILALSLPEILFWSGFGLSIIHYCLNKGLMECEGWHFNFRKTLPEIPEFMKKIFAKIKRGFTQKIKPLSSRKILPLTQLNA